MRKWLVMVACLAVAPVFAANVSKPAVTLEIPDGWVEVPPGILQAFFDELKRQAPLQQVPKYDYAFQSSAGPPWLSYPYLLVKITPGGRPTERELGELPKIDLNAKTRTKDEGWGDLIKDTSLGQMRYDKAANIVWLSSKSTIKDVGTVSGISGMIPTEQGFVELHGYAREADFARHLPTFEKIIAGARVAPHLVYRPHWTDARASSDRYDARVLGFLVAIGILVGVFLVIYRRRRH